MFDANLIIWLVISLSICTIAWNGFALIYARTSRAVHTKLSQEHPLLRWCFHAMEILVGIKIILLALLTWAQLIRNTFLVEIGPTQVPDWLFGVVVVQNILFYGTVTLPGVLLFAFTWALGVIDEQREKRLDARVAEYLGLEEEHVARLHRDRGNE